MTSFGAARVIPSSDGRYAACADGSIYSMVNPSVPRLMRPTKFGDGYLRVKVRCADGKKRMCAVHRLVAESFIENPEGKPVVNHKNGVKSDCAATNLEWATSRENMAHAVATGLHRTSTSVDDSRVQVARSMRDAGSGFKEIAARLGCSISTAFAYVKRGSSKGI